MAIDVTNRNPQDPQGIFSFDPTSAVDAWISEDWSRVAYSADEAKKQGLTRKVRIARAITNIGDKYDVLVSDSGQPISQIGDRTGVDDKVASVWKSTPRVDTATEEHTAELERQRKANRDAGRGYYTDGELATDAERRAREAAANRGKVGPELVYGEGGNVDVVTWAIDANGNKGAIIDKHPASQDEINKYKPPVAKGNEEIIPVEGHPGIFQKTTKNVSADGSTTTGAITFVDAQGNTVADPRKPTPKVQEDPNNPGKWISITVDPATGEPVIKSVAGPEAAKPGHALDPTKLRLEAGNITEEGKQLLQRIQEKLDTDPNYTWKDGEREWNQFESLKGTRLQEIRDILTTQTSIYSQESANYREQLQDQSNRRTFAGNVMGQALRTVEAVNPTLQPGSTKGGEGLLALMAIGAQYASKMGGLNQIQAPTMGTGLQEAKGLSINGPGITVDANKGLVHINGGGSPAATAANTALQGQQVPGNVTLPAGDPSQLTYRGGQLTSRPELPPPADVVQTQLESSQSPYLQQVQGTNPVDQVAAQQTAASMAADPFYGPDVQQMFNDKYGLSA